MTRVWLAAAMLIALSAHAGKETPQQAITKHFGGIVNAQGNEFFDPVFVFQTDGVDPIGTKDAVFNGMSLNAEAQKTVVGLAAGGKEAFLAADIVHHGDCGNPNPSCGKAIGWAHATALYQLTGEGWQPMVWHVGDTIDDAKYVAKIVDKGVAPQKFERKIDGADDVVKLFESSLADAKQFAKTVSDRKEVVLYGSGKNERIVGGKQVRAKLTAWNLALSVRDGVQAGLSPSKTLAWVAANVDAKSAKQAAAKPTPYRLLALYEKTGSTWKLVQAHFSFVERPR